MKIRFLILVFTLIPLFLFSCSNGEKLDKTRETVFFEFPAWPPDENYPELSRWLVEISSVEGQQKFFSEEEGFVLDVVKNSPVGVSVTPITRNSKGDELRFFKPAGALYPYDGEPCGEEIEGKDISWKQELTWEQGYSTYIFQSLSKSRKETGITLEHMEKFLGSFNWKKFQDTIQKNIDASIAAFSDEEVKNPKMYNPWQIDSFSLLDNLCYASFKPNLLNIKNQFGVRLDFEEEDNQFLLSSFIPENEIVKNRKQISVVKGESAIFSYQKDYALIILYSSSKKISLQEVFMPIFIEEI